MHPLDKVPENDPERKFALRIEDDGCGMDHTTLVNMFKLASDSDARCARGIAGYGIGFQAGALSFGHTAVVLTRTKKTYSVGVLSNAPWELNKEILAPRSRAPVVGDKFVITRDVDTQIIVENGGTEAGKC